MLEKYEKISRIFLFIFVPSFPLFYSLSYFEALNIWVPKKLFSFEEYVHRIDTDMVKYKNQGHIHKSTIDI